MAHKILIKGNDKIPEFCYITEDIKRVGDHLEFIDIKGNYRLVSLDLVNEVIPVKKRGDAD